MSKLNIISIQNGYFLKNSLNRKDVFHEVAGMDKFIKETLPDKEVQVEMSNFNISDIICLFKWEEYSIAMSMQRIDLFYSSKYALENQKNYTSVLDSMRSVMSALFSYLNNKYGVNRLGLVGNYMMTDLGCRPIEYINNNILADRLKDKRFSVNSLEGQNSISWNELRVNDVKRVWDALYNAQGKEAVPNLGILRDINIPVADSKLSDEFYNQFISFASDYLNNEAITRLVS